MNPVLRHYGMIFHPPALYLGYISIFIPGAYQVSTLIHRQTGTDWLKKTRSWYLFAWFFLAVGLILGSRWAYDVLGWGGYWGWDPVEVSALIPFLLLTAFIHAVIGNIYTQKYQRWLMVSGLLSLFSIVISTFVTRSGLISSVHAFSASPLSRPLSIYFGLFFIFILGLIILRWHSVSPSSPSTEEQPTAKFSLFSRHFVFNAMILILFVITFFCLWGIFLPNISALFSDRPITIGKDYYTSSTGPLFLLFILLTGFFPLSHWKQADKSKDRLALILLSAVAAVIAAVVNFKTGTSSLMTILAVWIIAFSFFVYLYDWLRNAVTYQDGKRVLVFSKFWTQFTKNPRRFSILLLHTGLLLMALGILGIESFQAEERLTMTKDQTVTFHNYAITYQGIQESEFPEGSLLRADFQVVDENNRETVIQPQKRFFSAYQQMTTIPGIQSNLAGDLYLILNQADETEASFTFYYNPLINWLWIGSILLCLGGVFIYFGSLKRKKLHVQ